MEGNLDGDQKSVGEATEMPQILVAPGYTEPLPGPKIDLNNSNEVRAMDQEVVGRQMLNVLLAEMGGDGNLLSPDFCVRAAQLIRDNPSYTRSFCTFYYEWRAGLGQDSAELAPQITFELGDLMEVIVCPSSGNVTNMRPLDVGVPYAEPMAGGSSPEEVKEELRQGELEFRVNSELWTLNEKYGVVDMRDEDCCLDVARWIRNNPDCAEMFCLLYGYHFAQEPKRIASDLGLLIQTLLG